MSTIKTGTTLTTAYQVEGDTTGKFVVQTGSTPTTAMTIDTSQNVGIGTSSPSTRLHIAGAITATSQLTTQHTGSSITTLFGCDGAIDAGAVYVTTNHPLAFKTNNTERMRIDSSGNLLVGTTSANGKLTVVGGAVSASTYSMSVANSSYTFILCRDDGYAALPSTKDKTTGSAANLYIDSASGYLFRSTSSLKYKKNVQDAVHGLTDLLNLRSVTYEGKSESDDGKTFGGLIAEEVHDAGLTEFVQYAEDGTPDALAYGNMVSLCIKAIQEQQAIINAQQAALTSLTERITALENK